MRVLITGMGGELGSRVAAVVEQRPWATSVDGLDVEPPRIRLRRSHFTLVDPRDRRRVVRLVRELDPQVVIHVGVYEPNARSGPALAAARTADAALHVLGAAAQCPSLQTIVVRSGIEVYGRRRNAPLRPDEETPVDPTSPFGRSLVEAERLATEAGRAAGVPVTLVRCATLVGPHVPSPLGRVLRLPVVPFSALADPPFALLHQEDGAAALVAAAEARHDGPVNVVGTGGVSAFQAARLGDRIPFPVSGPGWLFARAVTELLGAPSPGHVVEVLRRGRTADGSSAAGLLGIAAPLPTIEVVKDLYAWATVTHLRPEFRTVPARRAR
jgi:UDP-glucose 4-epimerase